MRYVQQFRDRHGKRRYYLRRRGQKAIALPDDPNSPEFHAAYAAALAIVPQPKSRVVPQSLEDLTRRYRDSPVFSQLRDTTRANYNRILARLVREHGDKPARLLHAAAVRQLVHARAKTPAAANHVLRLLRALLRYAIELGWREDDPTRDVRRLKLRGKGPETWTEEDIAAFEAHWPRGTQPRLALALLLYTGQRRSDVVRMGRQHVRGNIIEVRQVKTGAKLLIPLHPELAALVDGARDRLTFLMTNEGDRAKPFTPNGFYMRFRSWCEAAGIPAGKSPHGLRKAAARRLAEAGCTAHQIAAVTGHTTLAEVQRYTVAADQARLAEQAISRIRPNKKRG